MITTSTPTQLTQAIGDHLLTTSLTCLVYFEAVRGLQNEIENFRLIFQNEAAIHSPFLSQAASLGTLLTDWNPQTKTTGLFHQYAAVVETGIPFQLEKHYEDFNQSFQLAVSKYNDGIMISYYNSTEHQRALQQAKHQAQLLGQIMESSHDFIMLWEPVRDKQGTIVDFRATHYNRAILNTGLFTEADFQQHTLTELDPSIRPFLAHYIQVIDTGVPYLTEQFLHRDSFRVWYDLSVTKLGDGVLSIFRNITEKKVAAYRLQRQSNLLEKILDSSDNAIFVAEALRNEAGDLADLKLIKWNEPARHTMLKLSGQDGIDSTLLTIFPNSQQQGLFPLFAKVIETAEPLELERYYEGPDQWYRVAIHKLADGIVATFVDITEVRKAAQAAEVSAQLIKGVLDASFNGMLLLEAIRDAQGEVTDFRYLLANQTASRINGIPLEELIGNTVLTLFPTSKTAGSFPDNVRALDTGESIRRQLSFVYNQIEGWYDFATQRINADMLVVSFMDITETKQLEADLKRSNQQLEEFASVASHDLQEPLRKIQSFGNLLTQQYSERLPADVLDLLNRMQSAANRMQGLIQGLLAYSRLTTQKDPHQPVNLALLLDDICNDLEETIAARKATLTIGQLPVLNGHPVQLRQLFQNLLSNALKYTAADVSPQIAIDARLASQADLQTLGGPTDSAWQVITITDNGIGFDEKYRDTIFEPFKRLHGRSKYAGMGLGLAICKRVVNLHGGRIKVASVPGQGSCFTVLLPVFQA